MGAHNLKHLSVGLSTEGYSLVLDISKDQNPDDKPHWYLYKDGKRIARINWNAYWEEKPSSLDLSIAQEAERTTIKYSPLIREYYYYNQSHSA